MITVVAGSEEGYLAKQQVVLEEEVDPKRSIMR